MGAICDGVLGAVLLILLGVGLVLPEAEGDVAPPPGEALAGVLVEALDLVSSSRRTSHATAPIATRSARAAAMRRAGRGPPVRAPGGEPPLPG